MTKPFKYGWEAGQIPNVSVYLRSSELFHSQAQHWLDEDFAAVFFRDRFYSTLRGKEQEIIIVALKVIKLEPHQSFHPAAIFKSIKVRQR